MTRCNDNAVQVGKMEIVVNSAAYNSRLRHKTSPHIPAPVYVTASQQVDGSGASIPEHTITTTVLYSLTRLLFTILGALLWI